MWKEGRVSCFCHFENMIQTRKQYFSTVIVAFSSVASLADWVNGWGKPSCLQPCQSMLLTLVDFKLFQKFTKCTQQNITSVCTILTYGRPAWRWNWMQDSRKDNNKCSTRTIFYVSLPHLLIRISVYNDMSGNMSDLLLVAQGGKVGGSVVSLRYASLSQTLKRPKHKSLNMNT